MHLTSDQPRKVIAVFTKDGRRYGFDPEAAKHGVMLLAGQIGVNQIDRIETVSVDENGMEIK